jgi:hypothetical protein
MNSLFIQYVEVAGTDGFHKTVNEMNCFIYSQIISDGEIQACNVLIKYRIHKLKCFVFTIEEFHIIDRLLPEFELIDYLITDIHHYI